jgi:DnaJ homolog subfamily C member 19
MPRHNQIREERPMGWVLIGIGIAIGWWWLKQQDGSASKPGEAMTDVQAREILGVTAEASSEEIQAAYKRLMHKLHPDKGGSAYLTSQLNNARERLLK